MKKMKGYIPTVALMLTMVLCTSAAQAGIIVGDRTGALTQDDPCSDKTTSQQILGIVTDIASFATGGIIVGDYAGNQTCGIIVGDRTAQQKGGIIVGD
jgi:hypothetical protein